MIFIKEVYCQLMLFMKRRKVYCSLTGFYIKGAEVYCQLMLFIKESGVFPVDAFYENLTFLS